MIRFLLVLLFALALFAPLSAPTTVWADDTETLPGSTYEPPPGFGWVDEFVAAWKRVWDDKTNLRPAVVRA